MSCKARWLLPFAHMRKPSPHSERAWPGLQGGGKGGDTSGTGSLSGFCCLDAFQPLCSRGLCLSLFLS